MHDKSIGGLTSFFVITFVLIDRDNANIDKSSGKLTANVAETQLAFIEQRMKMFKLLEAALARKPKRTGQDLETQEIVIKASLKEISQVGEVFVDFTPRIVAIPNDWEKLWSLEEREKLSH